VIKNTPAALLFLVGIVALYHTIFFRGLVVEPLAVPPDFAKSGIDGTGLAARLRDRLNDLVTEADEYALRAPDDIRGDWGGESKVDVHQSDTSLDTVMRVLTELFSGETRLASEVYYSRDGGSRQMVLSLNLNGHLIGSFKSHDPKSKDPVCRTEKMDDGIDCLLSRAALAVLRETQPYRFAIVQAMHECKGNQPCLLSGARWMESAASTASNDDRAWFYSKASERLIALGHHEEGMADARRALAANAWLVPSYSDEARAAAGLGQDEVASAALSHGIFRWHFCILCRFAPLAQPTVLPGLEVQRAELTGDYTDAIVDQQKLASSTFADRNEYGAAAIATDLARQHDGRGALRILHSRFVGARPWTDEDGLQQFQTIGFAATQFFILIDRGKYREAEADLREAAGKVSNLGETKETFVRPWRADAYALEGAFHQAEEQIDRTPPGCYLCTRTRGRIYALERNWARAAALFAKAVEQAPSPPFAYADWGEMLLRRADFDGAIAKFEIANEKGPHFADPLEMWGEALIAKNRSDLALPKFQAANKYAPNWGRLHLKWGEALLWSGNKDVARKQFALASRLDLTPAETLELETVQGRS
jgi:tetratricopeptide (TPR) repeat protein